MTQQHGSANKRPARSSNSISDPTKLTVPGLISVGVFTAVYFVLVAIATFASGAIVPGFSNVILPALAALISGCVYMLLVAKVQKFGAITIMGCVMGLFFLVSGHFALAFIANVACAVVADLVARAGSYKSRAGLLASYVVFSYGLTGPVLPLWLMKDAYVANLEARGKSAEYIGNLFANINQTTLAVCIVSILVCAVVGGLFGQRMMKKHFEKAGII